MALLVFVLIGAIINCIISIILKEYFVILFVLPFCIFAVILFFKLKKSNRKNKLLLKYILITFNVIMYTAVLFGILDIFFNIMSDSFFGGIAEWLMLIPTVVSGGWLIYKCKNLPMD